MSHPSNDCMLKAQGLSKTFTTRRGTLHILKDIDVQVGAGESLVIHGQSGIGKSTLLQILAGLDQPTVGTVTLLGQPLHSLSEGQRSVLRRDQVGMVFQNHNLLPAWTSLENVEAPLMHTSLSRHKRRRRAVQLLEQLQLSDRLDHLPAELSMGQRQRVAIARALVNEPLILFTDEPTGDMDAAAGLDIIAHLRELVQQRHITLVVATHGTFPIIDTDQVLTLT